MTEKSKDLRHQPLTWLIGYAVFFLLLSEVIVKDHPFKIKEGLPQVFFLLATWFCLRSAGLKASAIGWHLKNVFKEMQLAFAVSLVPVLVVGALVIISNAPLQPIRWQHFFSYHLFIILVMAPISEELFFRGVLTKALENVLPRPALVLVVAFLFMIAHFDLLLGPFLLGVACTILVIWRGSLIAPIILHAACNLIGPLLVQIAPETLRRLHLFFF